MHDLTQQMTANKLVRQRLSLTPAVAFADDDDDDNDDGCNSVDAAAAAHVAATDDAAAAAASGGASPNGNAMQHLRFANFKSRRRYSDVDVFTELRSRKDVFK
jgi:hypothetical protein